MSAILRIKGPVCTHIAIHSNGPMGVRNIVKSQFLRAAQRLEAANLGFMTKIGNNDVFIKRQPLDVQLQAALEANQDLCYLQDYTARFFMTAPKCISQTLRGQLVANQLVKAEHFGIAYINDVS